MNFIPLPARTWKWSWPAVFCWSSDLGQLSPADHEISAYKISSSTLGTGPRSQLLFENGPYGPNIGTGPRSQLLFENGPYGPNIV